MTQAQLEDAVAEATGEPACLIRGMGFSLVPCEMEPEDLGLFVACPHCSRPVPYPGASRDGSPALAGCADCDALFVAAPGAVFATGPARP